MPCGAVRTLTPGRTPMLQSRWRQSTQAPPPKAPPWGLGGLGRAPIQGRHGSALRQCNHDPVESALGRESQGEVPTGRCLAPGERTAVQQSEGHRNRSLFVLATPWRPPQCMFASPAHARTSSADNNERALLAWCCERAPDLAMARPPGQTWGDLGSTRKHSGGGEHRKLTSSNHHTQATSHTECSLTPPTHDMLQNVLDASESPSLAHGARRVGWVDGKGSGV